MGKGNRRDSRKRPHTEDDELDPMDPSSYSDAPRGGWYVIHTFLSFGKLSVTGALLFFLSQNWTLV